MLCYPRAWFLLIVLLVAPAGWGETVETAEDRPAAAAPSDDQIADAVRRLGAGDFDAREQATRTLWSAGEAAEPALRRALDDADPEIVRRARLILSNIAYGITPDMSDEIVALMARYRTGDAQAKRAAVHELSGRGGVGARVLLKLRDEEQDRATRALIRLVLTQQSRSLAVSLIADGDPLTAGRVLEAAAQSGEASAAMNYAAFLLVQGGLDKAIADTRAALDKLEAGELDEQPDDEGIDAKQAAANTAALLAYLHRADGDLVAARAAAERSGRDDLVRNILAEIGDWKELARRSDAAIAADGDAGVGDLGVLCFAAAFHRMAGDEAGVDKLAAQLVAAADRDSDQSWVVVEGLLLNGRVDQAVGVMIGHGHLAELADVYFRRMSFDAFLRLLERARVGESPRLGEIEVAGLRAGWFTGEMDAEKATAALDAVVKACEDRRDFAGIAAAVGAATEMGLADRARWYAIAAMQVAQRARRPGVARAPSVSIATIFEQVRFRDAARAAGWWRVMQQRFPKQPAGLTLDMLRAIDANQMKGDALQALCDASAADAARRPPEEHFVQLALIADTLAAAGRRPAAVARYTELVSLADRFDPPRAAGVLSRLAEFDAEAGHWRAAAEGYARAWARDRANPVPLYLSGWALAQAGDPSNGSRRMERAHLIPLADDTRRHDLIEAMLARNVVDRTPPPLDPMDNPPAAPPRLDEAPPAQPRLDEALPAQERVENAPPAKIVIDKAPADRTLIEEARREREIILRTAPFLSWRRSDALRRAGDDAHAAGNATRAADLWDRAFLDNNSASTRFVEPWANVSMPALVHRTRAVGLIRAGEVEAGMKEADTALAMQPGDADGVIEIVGALDAAGHKPEADAFYRRASGRYAKLCAAYPQSGPLHNLYAWTAAKCHRELDSALAHATRAVELQPTNTASLDTLAETHFQRGEIPQAIAVMERCVELEPDEAHHAEQLTRFRKAALGMP